MADVGIAKAGEDVPGRGDGEEEQKSGEGAEFAPSAPGSGEDEVGNCRGDEEDGGDEAFGEDAEGERGPHPVDIDGLAVFEAGDEEVERERGEEGEQDFGDEDAGEEEGSDAGEDAEGGVEGGAVAEGGGPDPGEEGAAEDSEGLRQVGGEDVVAEDAVVEGDDPVGERGFFEIADAVDVEGDPISSLGDVFGDLGVGGVSVVEERRREERGDVDGDEDRDEKHPGFEGRVLGLGLFQRGWFAGARNDEVSVGVVPGDAGSHGALLV